MIKEKVLKSLLLLLMLRFSKDLNKIKAIRFITLNVFKNNRPFSVLFLCIIIIKLNFEYGTK